MGVVLIDWTARVTVACIAARVVLALSRHSRMPRFGEVVLWTIGWALLVVHVACAFHFQHGWSHAAACEHTARRTAETVGWHWGGGVYFNYLTVAIWGVDAAVFVRSYRKAGPAPRIWSLFARAWIGFMVVNATLVFGPRWWWLVAVSVTTAAVVAHVYRRHSRSASPDRLDEVHLR